MCTEQEEILCDGCEHIDVCGKCVATGGVTRCTHYLSKKPEPCEYCRNAVYTDKPFEVKTQMGYFVRVQFRFCPACGNEIRGGYECE